MLNAAHANRKSPQLSVHPSDILHVKMVEFQRVPRPFLESLAAREALRQAAVDHRAAGGAILIARPEHVERVIDHLLHQGVALEGGRGPGAGPTTMLKDVRAGTKGGGRKAHQR